MEYTGGAWLEGSKVGYVGYVLYVLWGKSVKTRVFSTFSHPWEYVASDPRLRILAKSE
jgi:hypothetical protein